MKENTLATKMLDFFMWKMDNYKKISSLYIRKEDYEKPVKDVRFYSFDDLLNEYVEYVKSHKQL